MLPHPSLAPSADGTSHGQVKEVVNDAIPVADEDSVCSAQVWLTLQRQVQGSDKQPGRGYPRLTPTYLFGIELHEAHYVAIFLESDKEIYHRGEGKDCKHCKKSFRAVLGMGRA